MTKETLEKANDLDQKIIDLVRFIESYEEYKDNIKRPSVNCSERLWPDFYEFAKLLKEQTVNEFNNLK